MNRDVPAQRTSGMRHTGARGSVQLPVLRLCAGRCEHNQWAARAKAFSGDVMDRHGLCWSRSLERRSPGARSRSEERSGWQEASAHRGPAASTLALKERAMSLAVGPTVTASVQWGYVLVCQGDGAAFE